MSDNLDEKLVPLYQTVIQRNPGEAEFHQSVREGFDSLGPVLAKHPEFGDYKIIERICEPERQIIFRVSWQNDMSPAVICGKSRVMWLYHVPPRTNSPEESHHSC